MTVSTIEKLNFRNNPDGTPTEETLGRTARSILESIPYLVACDRDGNITYITKQYARIFGKQSEDLIGQPITDYIANSRLPVVVRTQSSELNYHVLPNLISGGSLCQREPIYEHGLSGGGEVTGAVGFTVLSRSSRIGDLLDQIDTLEHQLKLYREHMSGVYQQTAEIPEVLGHSKAVEEIKELITKVAVSSATVCICGETGPGKELVANAIHSLSSRSSKPFVKINCAAIPTELLESELFGYEAGAFTGASRSGKIGKFELANGGTLLLDEIGEMPLGLQAKLLRTLQEQQIERIGGRKPIPIDVRILCSTNRDLKQLIADGQFRADLYYRLNTIEVNVPALRDRKEDIDELAECFINEINERDHLHVAGYTGSVREALLRYDWPGNVRELQHAIERACILCETGRLRPEHFDSRFFPDRGAASAGRENAGGVSSLKAQKNALEKERILEALRITGGNRKAAAQYLGIQRSALYKKLEKYGIR